MQVFAPNVITEIYVHTLVGDISWLQKCINLYSLENAWIFKVTLKCDTCTKQCNEPASLL